MTGRRVRRTCSEFDFPIAARIVAALPKNAGVSPGLPLAGWHYWDNNNHKRNKIR